MDSEKNVTREEMERQVVQGLAKIADIDQRQKQTFEKMDQNLARFYELDRKLAENEELIAGRLATKTK